MTLSCYCGGGGGGVGVEEEEEEKEEEEEEEFKCRIQCTELLTRMTAQIGFSCAYIGVWAWFPN